MSDTTPIPGWFDLRLYPAHILKSYGAAKWFYLLGLRKRLYEDESSESAGSFAKLLQDPLITGVSPYTRHHRKLIDQCGNEWEAKLQGEWTPTSENYLVKKLLRKAAEHQSPAKLQDETLNPTASLSSLNIQIDLQATDKTIHTEIQRLLNQLRAKGYAPGLKCPLSPKRLRKLSAYNVLPILDLKIWDKKFNSGRQTSPSAIASLFDLTYNDLTQKHYGTVREVLSDSFLLELAAAAAQEDSEPNRQLLTN